MNVQDPSIELEIEKLVKLLTSYQKAYYVDSRPSVSDLEYDKLFDQLKALEEEYPDLRRPDSPTERVGSDLDSNFEEVEHTIPVLSLDKAYSSTELEQWISKTESKLSQQLGIVIEEKIDGISIVLYYENGLLARAVTRGNGAIGNDVTANIKTMNSVPLRLPQNDTVAIRGEVYLEKKSFAALNETMEVPYANPRNLAAGTIRRIKSSETAKVPLRMFAYEGFWENGREFTDHLHILSTLTSYGFSINKNLAFFCNDGQLAKNKLAEVGLTGFSGSYSDIDAYIKEHTEKRSSLAYEIDGLVAKVNEIGLRDQLGYTEHHPRWAMAYKFESPQAQTVVEKIDLQVGRTGRVTPVAKVRPVQVGGATISNITLHNQQYIDMLELGLGDVVEISRRGDVIPAVERVMEKSVDGHPIWKMQDDCPVCATPLVTKGAHTFCPNPLCPAQVKGRIEFFIGKDAMDIENFGPETAKFLIEKGLVSDIADLYTIDYRKALADEKGFGPKKILLIEEGIKKSLEAPFRKVLVALGIPELGKKGVDLLISDGLKSMGQLMEIAATSNVDRLVSIKQIGPKSAQFLIDSLNDEVMQKRIEALRQVGLAMEEITEQKEQLDPVFAGQVWCVTGSFEHYNPRSLAMDEVASRGGRTVSSITGKTTHLLAGSGAGSKLEAARKLGVQVVGEQEFLQMLQGGLKKSEKQVEVQGEFSF